MDQLEELALIISGDHGRIDLERVAEALGCTRLQLAKPKEVQQITGYTVGSVSLILPLPCIVDRGLFRYPYIYGGTGAPASTLKLDPHDLEKVNHVIAFSG
jgi:prolyl-tRNA editing enzyme YbaK/EbsC (Cys-tRNA(Pro) deacylase)